MQNKKNLIVSPTEQQGKRIRKAYFFVALALVLCMVLSVPAFAAGPLDAIDNLYEFVFSAIKAIGFIILGFGILQLGMSFKSHDPTRRATGLLSVFGGLVIAFAKEILDLIVA